MAEPRIPTAHAELPSIITSLSRAHWGVLAEQGQVVQALHRLPVLGCQLKAHRVFQDEAQAGQRVPVCGEVEALVLLLELNPVLQHAQVMPDVEIAGGPDAGYDAFSVHKSPVIC